MNDHHGYIYELLRKLGLSTFQSSTGEFLLVRPLKIALIVVLAIVTSSVDKDTLFQIFSGVTTGLSDATLDPFVANMHTALWVLAATSVFGGFICLLRPKGD